MLTAAWMHLRLHELVPTVSFHGRIRHAAFGVYSMPGNIDLLGIAGALLGGFLYSLIQGASVEPFSLARQNWYGWIVAILGAMALVWMYPLAYPRKWWN